MDNTMLSPWTFLILFSTSFLVECVGRVPGYSNVIDGRPAMLGAAKSFMYQLQGLDEPGALDALAKTEYPLLVLEPGHNIKGSPFDTAAMIQKLRTTPKGNKRLLIAYLNIGQAEDYRTYWGNDWVAPTPLGRGTPDFLLSTDPDGWPGNYPVAYWDSRWKALLLGDSGLVAILASFGFDGIYLDWVGGCYDKKVIAAAQLAGVDPELEMIRLIEELAAAGRAITPDFLIIPQNAEYLLNVAPARYAATINGLGVEDTWFSGDASAGWDDPLAGDIPNNTEGDNSTQAKILQYAKYQKYGLPVLAIDYCISRTNAAQVYSNARNAGLIPLVTRVSLSRLTETPPDDFP